MSLGTFVLTIGGEQQDGTAENKARLHLLPQGVDTLIDADADEFKFPTKFAKATGVAISLPYTITLFTDSTSGASTTIGYKGYVATENGGRVDFEIAAQQAGTTTALTDLTDEVVFPISTTQQYRDEAETARDEAVAAAASVPTDAELSATYARVRAVDSAIANGATDNRAAIQAVIDACLPGDTVRIYAGNAGAAYRIHGPLYIPTGVTIDARGATVERGADAMAGMLTNKLNSVGGYGDTTDIKVIGGTWNGRRAAFAGPCNIFGFAHCDRVYVADATLKGVLNYHHIELNGCRDVLVERCAISDGLWTSGGGQEAIQIDSSYADGVFMTPSWPGFVIDGTVCTRITIRDCSFDNVQTGIGNHVVSGPPHTEIAILRNKFRTMANYGVIMQNCNGVRVIENDVAGAVGGLAVYLGDDTTRNGVEASGNVVRGITTGKSLWIKGIADGTLYGPVVIERNRFLTETSDHGIVVEFARGLVLRDNESAAAKASFYLFRCVNARVLGNRATGTYPSTSGQGKIQVGSGADLTLDTDIVISGNVADSIFVTSGTRITMSDNIVTATSFLNGTLSSGRHHNWINNVWTP